MNTSPDVNSELSFVQDIMHDAIDVMRLFPEGFSKTNTSRPEIQTSMMFADSVNKILTDKKMQVWLRRLMESFPKGFQPVFIQSSSVIAQILGSFSDDHLPTLMELSLRDEKAFMLLNSLMQLRSERKASGDKEEGFELAIQNELYRRQVAAGLPYRQLLTTLLGRDALLWLKADSRDGYGKMQPHEFSRSGWIDLWTIKAQIDIEKEFLEIPPQYDHLSKIVVALSWTLAALASFIPSSIFLGEALPTITSLRDGRLTITNAQYTVGSFYPGSMLKLVQILAEGIVNPLLSAADLMWVAVSLAKLHEVKTSVTRTAILNEARFNIFLSHRGLDAKLVLSESVRQLHADHGIFLDCLTLPHGVINRSFVFGSLAKSDKILIIETENFYHSDWCKKEAWFADALALIGAATVERVSLDAAKERISTEGPLSHKKSPDYALDYPVTSRVLRDIDDWSRAPNIHSLKASGYPVHYLLELENVCKEETRPGDETWVKTTAGIILKTLKNVIGQYPEGDPFDVWSAALQLCFAVFGIGAYARSKVEVRQSIDEMNAALKAILAADLHKHALFKEKGEHYLALVAAAAVLSLTGFTLNNNILPLVQKTLHSVARLQDGLLLADARNPGPKRDFQLRFIVKLINNNIGSVGIVQNAEAPVHQQQVDGFPLEILPCVTLYPGMRDPFAATV